MTQQPFSQQQPSAPYRQLRRSRADRKIGGVCGGLGAYFAVDPTLVRVAFVVLSVLTGGGFILAYLLAVLIIPDEPVWQDRPAPPYQAGQAYSPSQPHQPPAA